MFYVIYFLLVIINKSISNIILIYSYVIHHSAITGYKINSPF